MQITRRRLQVSLGVLWLVDGVLQCQPSMFGASFSHKILGAAREGLPSIIADPLHTVATLVSTQPVVANIIFAAIQIGLGVGLLTHRFSKAALAASIAWALSVWVVGEGLGGISNGSTILTGAPGAALLYAVIAVLAWPKRGSQGYESPSWLALVAWCLLWLVGAGLQMLGGNNSKISFSMTLRAAQTNAPQWVSSIDSHLAILHWPSWLAAVSISLYVLVAMWALVPGRTRQVAIGLGVTIAAMSWLLFQGLGDLTSGTATDLNTGPLIVLLALAVVGVQKGARTTRE